MIAIKKSFFVSVFALLFLFISSAMAGNLERGISLYNQKDYVQAFQIIEKEAKNGDSEAQYYLGRIYDFGEGKKKDVKKAFYWYSKGANQGNRKAQNNLASLYANGEGVNKDLKKALELYTLSANQGTADAQFNLGVMYREGEGTKRDYRKALELFKQASRQEHVRVMHAIGLAYHLGMGVPVDKNEAIKWYKKAADKGFTPSMWNLSILYLPEDNPDDTKRWEEVYKWYTLGMQHGDRKNAPFGMGLIYLMGWGNYPKDYAKAHELFTLAAENGKADGWYWLGVMEENGFGRPANRDKAFELYRKAASLDSRLAIPRLKQETSGTGVIQSIKELISPLK